MSTVDQAKYILMSNGRVIESGDDAKVMIGRFALHNPKVPAVVKPWRKHVWVDGVPDSIYENEFCSACEAIRQRDGSLDKMPCRMPEAVDESIEIIEFHPPHNDERCCIEHNHHARMMHVNCLFR